MRVRVVVSLANQQWVSLHFDTALKAKECIAKWTDEQKRLIENGQPDGVQTALWECLDKNGNPVAAVMGRYIVGMYIPDDPVQDADVDLLIETIERHADESEQWKG